MTTTVTLDSELAAQARRLDINISAAARGGVAAAVREALATADRAAYIEHPSETKTGGMRPRHGAIVERAGVVNRGDVLLAEFGTKVRPVLVLTRNEVIDVRLFVTIAEITTSMRGIGAEVPFDWRGVGLDEASVVNCDGLHTVRQSSLTRRVGAVDAETMRAVCSATTFAIGC